MKLIEWIKPRNKKKRSEFRNTIKSQYNNKKRRRK